MNSKFTPPGEGPQPPPGQVPVAASTTTQLHHGKDKDPPSVKNEIGGVQLGAGPHALVDFSAGLTLNLGNFESARIDVRLALPCDPRDRDAAFESAKAWVAARLQHEVGVVREGKSKVF